LKLFVLRKLANIGLGFLLEHRDFFIQTSSTVIKWWKGKKIAIIGPQESGKDALWNRLQGLDPKETSSLDQSRVPHFKIDFRLSNGKRINLTCKRSLNIGGEENHRDQVLGWRAVCEDADIIFYLISIDDLLEHRYLSGRIKSDLQWIYKTIPYLKSDPHLHILINKIDLKINSHTEYSEYKNKLKDELEKLDSFVKSQLEPWDRSYAGSTLISVYDEGLYLKGIENAFNAVYERVVTDKT